MKKEKYVKIINGECVDVESVTLTDEESILFTAELKALLAKGSITDYKGVEEWAMTWEAEEENE